MQKGVMQKGVMQKGVMQKGVMQKGVMQKSVMQKSVMQVSSLPLWLFQFKGHCYVRTVDRGAHNIYLQCSSFR